MLKESMHQHLINESLHWFTRDELEGMQMVSRGFRDLVLVNSKSLPLRALCNVDMVRVKRAPRKFSVFLVFSQTNNFSTFC